MRDRLSNFEKYLGALTATGQQTEPLNVRHFQKGTLTLDVVGHSGGKMSFVLEGTNNKGEGRWFNLDPREQDVEVDSDGIYAMTYEAEITWLRLRWVSGDANFVKVSAFISKTITSRK